MVRWESVKSVEPKSLREAPKKITRLELDIGGPGRRKARGARKLGYRINYADLDG